jgi:hypothetical protein
MILAHLGGVPVEELLPSLTGASVALLIARTWIMRRLGR